MWATIRNLGVFQGLWFLLVLGGDAYAIFALGWFLFHYVSYSEPRRKASASDLCRARDLDG